MLPQKVPQILINRESLKHLNFDIELLGDCDVIVNEILLRLDEKNKLKESASNESQSWSSICNEKHLLQEIRDEEADSLLYSRLNQSSVGDHSDASNSSLNNSTIIIENQNKISSADTEEQKAVETEGVKELESASDDSKFKKYTKDYLKENSFLYFKPNMYVFHGAEISLKNTRKRLKHLRKLVNSQGNENPNEETTNNEEENSLPDDEDDSDELTDDDEDSDDDDDDDSDDDESEDESDEESEKAEATKAIGSTCIVDSVNDDDDDDEDDEDFEPDLNKNNLTDFINANLSAKSLDELDQKKKTRFS